MHVFVMSVRSANGDHHVTKSSQAAPVARNVHEEKYGVCVCVEEGVSVGGRGQEDMIRELSASASQTNIHL